MSNEINEPLSSTSTTTSNEQKIEAHSELVVKMETDTHALNQVIEEIQDTPMIDIEDRNTNTNKTNENQDIKALVKIEELLSNEVNKDDTPVKTSPPPPPSEAVDVQTNTQQQQQSNNNTTQIDASLTPTITTFEEIQKQLKNTLDHVEQRNMVSGFQTLSKATAAVVDHCEQLGLTSDDHPYNAIDREQFWAGLNNCWLYALAQRHEPSGDTERLTDQHLYSLREMVVSWADKLERFGLVDYEMGWWEADILAAIDGILAMNYAAAQAAAQAVVAQAAAALFGEEVNM